MDRGVKVGRDLEGEALGSREAGVPRVREGKASCDLAEVHRGHLEAVDQHQGEDSSCSEVVEGSSYYVVEAAPLVQEEG